MTEPRRRDDPERSFQCVEPKRRRASLYEDVTIDSQPSIHRHVGDRDWPMFFEDGRGMWWAQSTQLSLRATGTRSATPARCGSAPTTSRAPRERSSWRGLWSPRAASGCWTTSPTSGSRSFAATSRCRRSWSTGCGWRSPTAGRDCLSDTITHCVVLDAAMKQRHAQAIVLYALDLDSHFEGFAVEPARQAWLGAEHWQPARGYLERLRTTTDWAKRLVAANLCFEPLVGILLRRELLMRAPKWGGDAVTSSVGHVAQLEWTWIRDWTAELVRFVESDEKHGEANREVLSGFINDWLPEATAAAEGLEPLFADLPAGNGLRGGARQRRARPRRAVRVRRRCGPGGGGAMSDDGKGTYDWVGIVMAKSAEGDAVADVLRGHDGIEIIEQPSFWEIKAKDRLVIDFDEVGEELGFEVDGYAIRHEISTHYGRLWPPMRR